LKYFQRRGRGDVGCGSGSLSNTEPAGRVIA
jgi:hypothetical protein